MSSGEEHRQAHAEQVLEYQPYYNAHPGVAAAANQGTPGEDRCEGDGNGRPCGPRLPSMGTIESDLLRFDGFRSAFPGLLPARMKSSGTLAPYLLTILVALSGV